MDEPQNIEGAIADAQRPSEGSEKTSYEELEYEKWKCRLAKEESKWLIYIDDVPTNLTQFSAEQNVSLCLLNDILCLQTGGIIHVLSISKDGKANVKANSVLSSCSQRKTNGNETATSDEENHRTQLTFTQTTTAEYDAHKNIDSASGATDQLGSDKNEHCDKKNCDNVRMHSGVAEDEILNAESESNHTYERANPSNSPDCKFNIHLADSSIKLSKNAKEAENIMSRTEYTKTDDKKEKSETKEKEYVKLLKNGWSLFVGEKETPLDFDENANVSLERRDEDLYLQVGGSLYEVVVNSDGYINISKIQEGIVISKEESGERNYSDTEKHNQGLRDTLRTMPFSNNTNVNSERDGNEQLKSLSIKQISKDMSKTNDKKFSQSLDGRIIKKDQVSENRDIKHDRHRNKLITIVTADGTNAVIPETKQPIFPDDKSAPSVLQPTQRVKSISIPENVRKKELYNSVSSHELDTNAVDHGGAIPKKTNKEQGANSYRSQTATGFQKIPGAVKSEECVPTNGSRHLNNILPSEYGKRTLKANVGETNLDAEKSAGSKHDSIVSIDIVVDNDDIFKVLTHSDILKKIAEDYKVTVIPRKTPSCQGFEITGLPEKIQHAGEKMKTFMKSIISETFTLETKDVTVTKTKEYLASIKNEVEENFHAIANFTVLEAKEDKDKLGRSTSIDKPDSQACRQIEILKFEERKRVYWLFPGGYKISLYNAAIEESTASTIVKFTNWNGREKQIISATAPDGFGGFIHNVTVGLPMCNGAEADKVDLKALLTKILIKAGEDKKPNIAFALQNILNWSCQTFVECLLAAVWEHFKSPDQDKPVFVELFSPKTSEYSSINFDCVRIVAEMEKEEFSKHDCISTQIIEGELNRTEQIISATAPDGFGGFIHNVTVGLPMCNGAEADKVDLKALLTKILIKAGEDKKPNIAFALQNILNWSCQTFVECLLAAVWEHFKSPDQDKPVFVELFSPKTSEYSSINFDCVRIVAEMEKEEFSKHDCISTQIIEGELNRTEAEVLVNTTSPTLQLNAGAVSAALLKKAGDRLQEDCKRFYPRGIKWGEIAVTQGYSLPCTYVFHGALPAFLTKMSDAEKFTAFRKFMETCLMRASKLGCRTIAFPVLGTGNLKYPVDLVASEMLLSVERFQKKYLRSPLQTVYIVVYPADRQTLQIFRRMQAEFGEPDKKGVQQRPPSEASSNDKGIVQSISTELTGWLSDVDDAAAYVKREWKELTSNYVHTFTMPLGRQTMGCGEQEKLRHYMEDVDIEMYKVKSKLYAKTHTYKALTDVFVVIGKLSTDESKSGQKHSLEQFEQIKVTVEVHNISKLRFKVMEKMNKTTLVKYKKDGFLFCHKRDSVFIEGRAKDIEVVLFEIEKLLAYIEKLEEICIDGDERRISKEMMVKTANEIDKKAAEKSDSCVIFEQEENKIYIFSRRKQVVLDLQTEILDKFKTQSGKQGNKFGAYDKYQERQDEKEKGNQSIQFKSRPDPLISIKTKSGIVNLYVYKDDLLNTRVQCIVNAANEYLSFSAGVAAAIANAAGTELLTEAQNHLKRHGKFPAGDVISTTAGNLKHKYEYVLHAVGPNWRDYLPLTDDTLQHCKLAIQSAVHKSLDLVDKYKLKSVAIPAISAGYQGVPSDICAQQYAEGIECYLESKKRPTVEEIHFVTLNDDTICVIRQTLYDFFVNKKTVNIDSKYLSDKKALEGTSSAKMTGIPKTEQSTQDVSALTNSFRQTLDPRDVREKMATDANKNIEYPYIWHTPSKSTVIQFITNQELHLYTANILELQSVNVIVVYETPSGNNLDTVAKNLMVKGAAKYISEKGKVFQSGKNLNFGDVIVTSGGDSRFKFVFHALIPQRHSFSESISKWYNAFQKILGVIFNKAVSMNVSSIAIPVMGTDSRTKDMYEYAKVFLESYKAFCLTKPSKQLAVHLVSSEPSLTATLKSLFERHIHSQQRHSGDPNFDYQPPSTAPKYDDAEDKKLKVSSEKAKEKEVDNCVICLDKLDKPKKMKCGHEFCSDCIAQHMKTKQNCPVCGMVFGKLTGNQPPGKMESAIIPDPLPGYEKYKTIRIVYGFGSGIQGREHPEPGKPYSGISRAAYLPDNKEGQQILKLLKIAFDRRLTFTIGQSRTTGHTGVITWNDIHHKTNTNPNTQFGYPDPTYFDRVKDELAAKGITEEDIK